MITPEFVMQKLAEPFDARDVAKPLKDEPLTRPLYNEYMRDSRKPKAPALPPRVQMQVGTPTLNQQRMDQDVASFGERLGGGTLGESINAGVAAQRVKAAEEPQKTVRKITPTTVRGVGRGGKGSTPLQQAGNAVTAAAPVVVARGQAKDDAKEAAGVYSSRASGLAALGAAGGAFAPAAGAALSAATKFGKENNQSAPAAGRTLYTANKPQNTKIVSKPGNKNNVHWERNIGAYKKYEDSGEAQSDETQWRGAGNFMNDIYDAVATPFGGSTPRFWAYGPGAVLGGASSLVGGGLYGAARGSEWLFSPTGR